MPDIGKSIEEFIREFSRKLEKGALPPDPLRVLGYILSGPPSIEHAIILPPLIEKIHAKIVEPAIEKAPRLPLTGDFPEQKWLEWKTE